MKQKTQRLWFVIIGALSISLALFIVLRTLEDNIVYFYTPSDVQVKSSQIKPGQRIRVGGYVVRGSITHTQDHSALEFVITDHKNLLRVYYKGALPNLFAEDQGVVAEGILTLQNKLIADRILAKHDENYRPPGASL
ncbi:MAG: cytochrome c maturation protein CcmE [Pseudomonadota bacterium]